MLLLTLLLTPAAVCFFFFLPEAPAASLLPASAASSSPSASWISMTGAGQPLLSRFWSLASDLSNDLAFSPMYWRRNSLFLAYATSSRPLTSPFFAAASTTR